VWGFPTLGFLGGQWGFPTLVSVGVFPTGAVGVSHTGIFLFLTPCRVRDLFGLFETLYSLPVIGRLPTGRSIGQAETIWNPVFAVSRTARFNHFEETECDHLSDRGSNSMPVEAKFFEVCEGDREPPIIATGMVCKFDLKSVKDAPTAEAQDAHCRRIEHRDSPRCECAVDLRAFHATPRVDFANAIARLRTHDKLPSRLVLDLAKQPAAATSRTFL
jgi:hypothetical protein